MSVLETRQRPPSRSSVVEIVLTADSQAQNPSNPIRNLEICSLGDTVAAGGPRFAYPVVLDLHGVAVLVVGAGPVAARKVAGLAAAGRGRARRRPGGLGGDGGGARRRPRRHARAPAVPSRPTSTACASSSRRPATDVDHAVAAAATAAGIWVNAADRPDDCTFILPAIARNGAVIDRRQHRRRQPGARPAAPRRGRAAAQRRRRRARRAARRGTGSDQGSRAGRPRTTTGTARSTPCCAGPPTARRVE